MKLFIWGMVTLNTSAYHDSGSVIAIAETEERAKELLADRVKSFEDSNLRVFDLDEMSDFFPDEGCC